MFKLGESFTLSDIKLPEQAKPLHLIWIELGNYKFEAPNQHLNNWGKGEGCIGYWLGKYPLTQAQWQTVVIPPKINVDHLKNNYPASGIDWIQAMKYCRLLNIHYKNQLPKGYHFSLPTEVYWTYAAVSKTLNYYEESKEVSIQPGKNCLVQNITEVVVGKGTKWGFYDMQGNVEEWVYDNFVDCLPQLLPEWVGNRYPDSWVDEEGEMRALKGGNSPTWKEYRLFENGYSWEQAFTPQGIGFRVCLRPIFDWPNCDLNDPLLIEEGINMLE